MTRPLTQVDRDLGKYAQERTHKLMLDVVQAFDIADRAKGDALACIGATLLRTCVTIAVYCNVDRERWLTMCNEVYDKAQQEKRKHDND